MDGVWATLVTDVQFGFRSKRTNSPPERSYWDKSASSANRSASRSLSNVGSFLSLVGCCMKFHLSFSSRSHALCSANKNPANIAVRGISSMCGRGFCLLSLAGLAATYSPAAWAAVPWALEALTAEFGMGSGGIPPLGPPVRRRTEDRYQGPEIRNDLIPGARYLIPAIRHL